MAIASAAAKVQAKPGAQGARLVQRRCGGTSCQCESCRKKRLQRKAGGGGRGLQAFDASPSLSHGGARLAPLLLQTFGSAYGGDFSNVRIHNDSTSHMAARDVGARAFTLGQHVHFGAGEYQPDSPDGLHLLAHELAHTVQQRGSGIGDGSGDVEIDTVDSPLERAADAAADAALAGRTAHLAANAEHGLQTKLLQRKVGTAKGGTETATVDRHVDNFTVVHITRTVTERPCKEEPETRSKTPSDKIFYWDKDANAVGMRYEICNGRVKLSTKGEIDYDKVVDSAKNLLTTLQNNPALGNDLGALLNDRLGAATISATGDITFNGRWHSERLHPHWLHCGHAGTETQCSRDPEDHTQRVDLHHHRRR